jgi:hypothetical protein
MSAMTPPSPPAQGRATGATGTLVPTPAGASRARALPGVDAFLLLVAPVTSALALLVLAGVPSTVSAAGEAVRGLVLLAFWLIAPGAAVVRRLQLSRSTKVATTPLVGLALLTVVATIGSWTGVWVPRVSAALVALVALAVTLTDLVRVRSRLRILWPRRPGRATVVLTAALLMFLGLWIASVPAIRSARPSVLGLLVAGPWTFPAVILGTLAVLLLALRGRHLYVAAAAVLALVLVVRSTASVVSPVPVFPWTYKHLGVVEALQETHHVTSGFDVYMNWPGLFAAGAYFSDASGIAVLDLARWITPVLQVLLALEAAVLARALGARAEGCIAAAGLMVVVNWVGQDYFAPQALAICLAAGVVVLLVQSSRSRACVLLALGLYAAIVVTHQLTPYWLLALAVVMVVLRRAPWWLAAGMVLIAGGYLLSRLEVAEAYGLFSGFDPVSNAESRVPPVPALGRDVGGFFAKAGSLLVWGSTLAVLAARGLRMGWKRGWRSPDVLVPAAIAFSPFVLLAGQNYGGEANLRVTLYSVLGCAAVLGPALATALRRRAAVALAAAVWTAVVVAATAQAANGMWWVNLIRSEDVATARWLVHEDPDAEVIPLIAAWPGRTSVDYERYIGPFTLLEPGLDEIIRDGSDLDPAASIPLSPDVVTEIARADAGTTTYVVSTGTMRHYDAYYATYSPGDYAATLQGLAADPEWEVVRQVGDVQVFRYLGPATPAG